VPEEQARARLVANRSSPYRVNVPDIDFDEVARGMQPPEDDERFTRYRPDEPVTAWIDRLVVPMLSPFGVR